MGTYDYNDAPNPDEDAMRFSWAGDIRHRLPETYGGMPVVPVLSPDGSFTTTNIALRPSDLLPLKLHELPDGTFTDHPPTLAEIDEAEAMVDAPVVVDAKLDAVAAGPEDPRTPRDPETGAPVEEPARERDEPGPLPNEYPWEDRLPAEGAPVGPTKAVQRWADVAMWQAPEHVDPQRPKVTIVTATPDPLGVMAVVNAQYTGRNLTSVDAVTDDERREAFEAGAVSRLSEQPLEAVRFVINFENVSRAFTHQMVRTRMAGYAQESMRFGVKDNVHDAVKLPPSLAGTRPHGELAREYNAQNLDVEINLSREEKWRALWDRALSEIENSYRLLVDSGMPAEDARGLLPTNMLTRIHMMVDLKTLLGLAGMRLCTQAQFEWRAVFAELARTLREFAVGRDDAWQFELIAGSFRPVCFAANRCVMKAKSDRHCSIRDQVDRFEQLGVKSEYWEDDPSTWDLPADVRPIRPEQWLADPTAARVAP